MPCIYFFDQLRECMRIKSSLFSSLLQKFGLFVSKQGNTENAHIATAVDHAPNKNVLGIAHDQPMKLSATGLQMLIGFEGCRLTAYQDSALVWTIGFGTTRYPNGQAVQAGDHCSQAQAEFYLQHDLIGFERAVNLSVHVPLRRSQYDALVSLCYNIGVGAFKSSTLLQYLNAGNYTDASRQFDVWIKAGGKTVQGLINRRAAEKALFLK